MRVKCIDNGDGIGRGTGLLTEGKVYEVRGTLGGYYNILCDDGKEYSKLKIRFVGVR